MKFLISSILVILSISVSAQVSEIFLLKTVLTDSIINEHISDLCGIENNAFVLFHNSGNYVFNNGIVEFEEHKCDTTLVMIDCVEKETVPLRNSLFLQII